MTAQLPGIIKSIIVYIFNFFKLMKSNSVSRILANRVYHNCRQNALHCNSLKDFSKSFCIYDKLWNSFEKNTTCINKYAIVLLN